MDKKVNNFRTREMNEWIDIFMDNLENYLEEKDSKIKKNFFRRVLNRIAIIFL